MIDLATESIIPVAEVPEHLGKMRPHVATVYRWAQVGLRGIRLETIRVGGTMCTSVEALQRWCEALTNGNGWRSAEAPESPPSDSPHSGARMTKARRRAIAAAEKELAEAGI